MCQVGWLYLKLFRYVTQGHSGESYHWKPQWRLTKGSSPLTPACKEYPPPPSNLIDKKTLLCFHFFDLKIGLFKNMFLTLFGGLEIFCLYPLSIFSTRISIFYKNGICRSYIHKRKHSCVTFSPLFSLSFVSPPSVSICNVGYLDQMTSWPQGHFKKLRPSLSSLSLFQ